MHICKWGARSAEGCDFEKSLDEIIMGNGHQVVSIARPGHPVGIWTLTTLKRVLPT